MTNSVTRAALRAVTVTATSQRAVLEELAVYVTATATSDAVVTVSFLPDVTAGQAAAVVVLASRDSAATVTPVELEELSYTPKPSWLTAELLAGDAIQAMFAYLDHNPDTGGADLTRWAQRYFPIGDAYGRKVKERWLERRRASQVPE